MNVMMITSLNTYTTNMKMEMKWQQKKTSGDFASDGAMTVEERLRKEAQETMGGIKSGKSKVSMGQIQTKLMSGKKLSSEEMDYLRENNPDLYKKAKAIEMEREAYERELKQCKTKEEVEKVKMAHTAASLARVNDIKSNPNIPKGEKLALMMEQLFKNKALGDVERQFVQSGEYKRLPSEEEQRQAEKELKEAQEAERGIEDKTDDTPEEIIKDAIAEEEAEETPGDEADGASAAEEILGAEEMTATDRMPAKETARHRVFPGSGEVSQKAEKVIGNTYSRNVRKAKETAAKTRMTRAEAEVTPEARKVKRARAKAAYTKTPNVGNATGNILNVKK